MTKELVRLLKYTLSLFISAKLSKNGVFAIIIWNSTCLIGVSTIINLTVGPPVTRSTARIRGMQLRW